MVYVQQVSYLWLDGSIVIYLFSFFFVDSFTDAHSIHISFGSGCFSIISLLYMIRSTNVSWVFSFL